MPVSHSGVSTVPISLDTGQMSVSHSGRLDRADSLDTGQMPVSHSITHSSTSSIPASTFESYWSKGRGGGPAVTLPVRSNAPP